MAEPDTADYSGFGFAMAHRPNAGAAVEVTVAFSAALRDRRDLALGSAVQIALIVAPLLVLLGYVIGLEPMGLQFWPAAAQRMRRTRAEGRRGTLRYRARQGHVTVPGIWAPDRGPATRPESKGMIRRSERPSSVVDPATLELPRPTLRTKPALAMAIGAGGHERQRVLHEGCSAWPTRDDA